MTSPAIELRVHSSLAEIPEAEWDALLGPSGPPYLRWAFLDALERTGCVAPEVGWAPAHLSFRLAGELLAAAPAYVKGNSEGEFVFDHSWAAFSEQRLHAAYYPKLVVACPFTPATGPRLLLRDDADPVVAYDAFRRGLEHFCEQAQLSSAHVLFTSEQQSGELEQRGLLVRHGIQFHWRNAGYATFEDFLARYPSKRRKQIRRERRELSEQGLELEVLSGSDLGAEQIDHLFEFYRDTVDKYSWSRRYLNRAFFEEICSRMGEQVLVIFARERGARSPIAGAFNLIGGGKLYGRYWGASRELRFLHFNVCYYQGIEECITRGLSTFEPGAGGEHKLARGFEPMITYSAHQLRHPVLSRAIDDFLRRERQAVRRELDLDPSVFKSET